MRQENQLLTKKKEIGMPLGRLETLSDAVFGVVIAFLVTLINDAPLQSSPGNLLQGIMDIKHLFLAYFITFILLSMYWWHHHLIFLYLRKSDTSFMWINMIFLLWIAFIPFPTNLLITYLKSPDQEVAILIYGGIHIICGFFLYCLWFYATHNHCLVVAHMPHRVIIKMKQLLLLNIGGYVLAIFISFLWMPLALMVFAGIIILNFIPYYKEAHEIEMNKVSGGG